MADVNISKYRASVVREGSTPASPGFVVSDGQNPVDPSGSGQNHLPVTITTAATGLSITESQVLGGAGTVGQYIRGDGSLADFPESSGGGSSVSYYLNGSVAQGTIGGVAYKELNKVPIIGGGTDFTINANGYIASFITDAGDPNLLEIPGGNWNFETYFSANNGGGSPTFYVELYKVNSGGTATLIASNSGFPELIAFGTNIISYFSTLAVPTTTLALTDRLAIRYYVTHSGRTITLHTEDNHLCQIITTFTTGITALNGLTAQVQNFAVGTSGTDFAISSATATHTFNLPTASATNRGALSAANWSTFNGKENAITAGTTLQYFRGDKTFQTLNTAAVPELTNLYYTEARVNANTNVAANTAARHNAVTLGTANGLSLSTQVLSLGLASAGVTGALSGTDWSTFNNKQNALGYTPVPETRTITINGTTQDLSANRTFNVGTVTSVGLSSATSGVTIGSTPVTGSGTITLAIATASGSQNGLLSSTDWTTFNSKQNALTNPVTGTGTTNYLPKFTGASTIGNSILQDDGTNVSIGYTTNPSLYKLDVNGTGRFSSSVTAGGSGNEFVYKAASSNIGTVGNWVGYLYGYNTSSYNKGATIFESTDGNGRGKFHIALNNDANSTNVSIADAKLTILPSGAATFSSSVTAASGLITGSGDVQFAINSTINAAYIDLQKNSVSKWQLVLERNTPIYGMAANDFGIYNTNTSSVNFKLANSTGAATFSSSVTAAGATFSGTTALASTGGTSQMRIDRSGSVARIQNYDIGSAANISLAYDGGNVGIGTTSPTYLLDVNGTGRFSSSSTNQLTLNGGTTVATRLLVARGTDDSSQNLLLGWNSITVQRTSVTITDPQTDFSIIQQASNGSRTALYIASTGAATFSSSVQASTLLVNTSTSPGSAKLAVLTTDSSAISTVTAVARFMNNGINYIPKIIITDNNTADATICLAGGSGAKRLSFGVQAATSGHEYLNILESGNVLVGTTTDNGARLQVNGAIRTAQPVGTTSNGWLLGRALISGTSTPNRWIRVQIGLEYYDILAVYMGTL